MTDDIHIDSSAILSKILDKVGDIGEDTASIKRALWPDDNQPGLLTQHGKRLEDLEGWRNRIVGALSLVAAGGLGVLKHVFGKH